MPMAFAGFRWRSGFGPLFASKGAELVTNSAIVENKDEVSAFSEFKRRLSSVMAFVMSRNFLFLISAVVLVALAACGKGSEDANDVSAQPEQETSTPAQAAQEQDGPNLMKALEDNSGVMTPEQQAAAVERARSNAEAAAKAVGQNEQQAQAAGEAAASSAQRSFSERQSQ